MVYKEWDGITVGLTIGIFTPIIDGSFLDEKPAVSLKKKEFKKTNILIGANKDEGFYFILYYLSDMFKRQEDVFINREDFERSIIELNVYANPLQRYQKTHRREGFFSFPKTLMLSGKPSSLNTQTG